MSRRRRFRFSLRTLLVLTAVVCIALGFDRWYASDRGWFYRSTGFHMPLSSKILSSGETHGGFLGDGESHVVFELDPAKLKQWLNEAPPWGIESWQVGPVPTEIGFHCSFGTPGVSGGENGYFGDPDLVAVLSSSNIRYAANERGDPWIRWHNGDLMIIDLDNNRVWFSSWDF